MNSKESTGTKASGELIHVVVSVQFVQGREDVMIDPWENCPSEVAREEGRYCNKCEFWGREVKGIDWSEFSLCLFDGTGESESE